MVTKKPEISELIAAAIKAGDAVRTREHVTNSPAQVRKCLDALNCLKALSLSHKHLMGSSALKKLQRLRDHPNPKIATEARSLFSTWMRTLYAKHSPPNKTCETDQALYENEIQLLHMFEGAKKAADTANTKGILLGKHEASRCVQILSKLMTFTVSRNLLETNRITERLEHLTKHRDRGICSSAVLLLQRWRERILTQESQASVTAAARKAVPKRPFQKKQPRHLEPEVPAKPRGSVTKRIENNRERTQVDILKDAAELTELFEAAKKAADAANVKGILLGQADVSRCVHCLSKLKTIPLNWEVVKAHGMERKLENLTKHKDRKICSAAAALLQLWRQSNGLREHRVSATKTKPFVPNLVAAAV